MGPGKMRQKSLTVVGGRALIVGDMDELWVRYKSGGGGGRGRPRGSGSGFVEVLSQELGRLGVGEVLELRVVDGRVFEWGERFVLARRVRDAIKYDQLRVGVLRGKRFSVRIGPGGIEVRRKGEEGDVKA